MFERIEIFDKRYAELNRRLYEPDVAANPDEYQKVMKEIKSIEEIVLTYRDYKAAQQTERDSLEILNDNSDSELKELAQLELDEAKETIERLSEQLKILLLPKDPNDERNVIVEIRGGAGGEESALFSALQGDLLYDQRRGRLFAFQIRERRSPCAARARDREPGTRAHLIDTFRSSGAGGQHINKTSSAIRITHLPTGTVVECQDERSQYKNKDKALKVLKSRLLKEKQDAQASEIAADRKSQVGTGDRSERIRTYNYPQGRLTDHRIGLTLYKLEDILNGNLDEVIDALVTADRAEKLKESMAQS